jgi:hypothetical protein
MAVHAPLAIPPDCLLPGSRGKAPDGEGYGPGLADDPGFNEPPRSRALNLTHKIQKFNRKGEEGE